MVKVQTKFLNLKEVIWADINASDINQLKQFLALAIQSGILEATFFG